MLEINFSIVFRRPSGRLANRVGIGLLVSHNLLVQVGTEQVLNPVVVGFLGHQQGDLVTRLQLLVESPNLVLDGVDPNRVAIDARPTRPDDFISGHVVGGDFVVSLVQTLANVIPDKISLESVGQGRYDFRGVKLLVQDVLDVVSVVNALERVVTDPKVPVPDERGASGERSVVPGDG